MDKVEIYYFSGTGNSLAVARDMAERLNARLMPVTSLLGRGSIDIEADKVGFVFPIYDFKPPAIFKEAVRNINNINSKYIFAVCTYGIASYNSLKYFSKIVIDCGGSVSAGFAVGMPQNGIGSAKNIEEECAGMFKDWQSRLDEVCGYIEGGNSGRIESSSLFSSVFQPRFMRLVPSLMKFLKHLLLKGVQSLKFTSDEKCTRCGTCKRVCPLENIEIVEDKPVWGDNCANCHACINWCPQEAISLGGYNMDTKCYHHPGVKLSDIIK